MNETAPLRDSSPPLKLKVVLWVALGLFSTAFAEVTCNNEPLTLFSAGGYLLIIPLYGLHILFLSTVVMRFGRPAWPVLCMAGALFGLYEAYITKVLWMPYWPQETGEMPALYFAEVAWLDTTTLVTWWHPLMAFILPLAVVETCCTSSRGVWGSLPDWVRLLRLAPGKAAIVLGAAVCALALVTASGPTSPLTTLVSAGGTVLYLLAVTLVWRRVLGGHRYTLSELLPGRRGLAVLSVLLVMLYGGLGSVMRTHALPGPAGHFSILALYAVFGALLVRGLRHAPPPGTVQLPAHDGRPLRLVAVTMPGYVAAVMSWEFVLAAVGAVSPDLQQAAVLATFVALFIVGSVVGVCACAVAAGTILRYPGQPTPGSHATANAVTESCSNRTPGAGL